MKKASLLLLGLLALNPLRAATAGANVGQSVTFSVTADGTQPFTYQWAKNGAAIVGATAATYVIPTAAATDAASYTVTVANAAGSTQSDTGTLLIIVPPANVKVNMTVAAGH